MRSAPALPLERRGLDSRGAAVAASVLGSSYPGRPTSLLRSVAGLQNGEIALGVDAVCPLLVQDRAQAVADDIAAGRRVAGHRVRLGLAVQFVVGEAVDERAYGRHPVGPERQDLVQRRPGVRIVRYAGDPAHLGE